MRGITVGELKEVIKGMDDHLPVRVFRCCGSSDPRHEQPDEPIVEHCRSTIHALVIEATDHDVADLIRAAYDGEDAMSERDDLKTENEELDAEVAKLERDIEILEAELAKLKQPTPA
jgi:dynactin complex subunit